MLKALLAHVATADRLVLLGDVVELRQDPPAVPMAAAAPVLAELGRAMAGREIVIVPGNHDHGLLDRWLERRSRRAAPPALGLATRVGHASDDLLAHLVRGLGAVSVSVSYPGVWLREDVYATHGHYLDLHNTVPSFERLGAGLMARLRGKLHPDHVEDYESVFTPMYAWIDAMALGGGHGGGGGDSAGAWRALTQRRGGLRELRRLGLGAGFRGLVAALNRAGIGELRGDLSGPALRGAALRAIGEVVDRLGVPAGYVLFGHTHRAGPLPGDHTGEWRSPRGVRLLNTGCWVSEMFGAEDPRSPYRPGFAVILEAAGPPRTVNLLEAPAPG